MEGNGPCGSDLLQIFVRLLDGKTAALRFTSGHVYAREIKNKISEITRIPPLSQRLISHGTQLNDESVISSKDSTVHLLLRLPGGKGGFGSLLRGAATKAGQKKTNNFDACRDMSGRRLRHVNAEKRLEEWKAEEEERRMERLAEEFIKKEAKKKKKGKVGGDEEAAKYVEKYRKDSEKCVGAVEAAVRSGLAGKKRMGKDKVEAVDAKRLKIWMGKRKLGESDSEYSSDDDNEENGKSTVTNSEDHLALTGGADGSSDSVTGRKLDEPSSAGASLESGSEEEKEASVEQTLKSSHCVEIVASDFIGEVQPDMQEETSPQGAGVTVSEAADDSALCEADIQLQQFMSTGGGETEECNRRDSKCEATQEPVSPNNVKEDSERPLNFDDFKSAADLEVLGMERLKNELQSRGLKCGGTLQERAARLFLLKSTPLEKLPKKLLAKK